jgi:5-oxoprolinase (ATP-hydrolysing) subunit A
VAVRALSIDLNCDVGERPEALRDGCEEALLGLVTSANIACGGHAGDETTMAATLRLATRLGVAPGAHPGYPDRDGFGRRRLGLTPGEIEETVAAQLHTLARAARREGCELTHVKPHGALYNDAAHEPEIARAIARAVRGFRNDILVFALAGSRALEVFGASGLAVVAEAFADRAYEADGSLRPRQLAGALLTDPATVAAQALAIARDGVVHAWDGAEVRVAAHTLCLHSDTPGAIANAAAVVAALRAQGIQLAPAKPASDKSP